jgi:hypothetical protein
MTTVDYINLLRDAAPEPPAGLGRALQAGGLVAGRVVPDADGRAAAGLVYRVDPGPGVPRVTILWLAEVPFEAPDGAAETLLGDLVGRGYTATGWVAAAFEAAARAESGSIVRRAGGQSLVALRPQPSLSVAPAAVE